MTKMLFTAAAVKGGFHAVVSKQEKVWLQLLVAVCTH